MKNRVRFIARTSLPIVIIISSIATAQQRLPFIGTRYFNFMGGSGTGQSITIEKDGTFTMKFYGKVKTSVTNRGKFSNPLILDDGSKYLLKDNKIYSITPNGQIRKGCRGEGILCESTLGI
jgi:hypothetical protein